MRQLMPMTPLAGDIGVADLAVLERYADPNVLVKLGKTRLTKLIARASHGQLGDDRANEWLASARSSIELYGGHPAVAFVDLAAEVTSEVVLLRATLESWIVAAAHDARPRRRYCAQAGPPARPDLLRPDRRARKGPHRSALRRGGQPRRAGLVDHGPRHALRCLRHGRPSRNAGGGGGHHCRALHGDRGDPAAPSVEKESGEGPPESPRGTFEAQRSRRKRTGRPSPPSIFPGWIHGGQDAGLNGLPAHLLS